MDLGSIVRVFWRFRFIVAFGLLLAAALAVFATAKPSYADGKVRLKYRSDESWTSSTALLVNQPGFTWGSTLSNSTEDPATEAQRTAEARLVTLAMIYSQLALGDEVRADIYRRELARGRQEGPRRDRRDARDRVESQ